MKNVIKMAEITLFNNHARNGRPSERLALWDTVCCVFYCIFWQIIYAYKKGHTVHSIHTILCRNGSMLVYYSEYSHCHKAKCGWHVTTESLCLEHFLTSILSSFIASLHSLSLFLPLTQLKTELLGSKFNSILEEGTVRLKFKMSM